MEITVLSTQDTKKLAESVATKTKPGTVFALHGDLGAGKTTFTGYLVKALGFDSRVQSPTFVLIRRYEKKNRTDAATEISRIYHIDLYRLSDPTELSDLGLMDLFEEKNAVILVEWPEIAESILPENTVHIYFEYDGENGRKINVQNLS
jgi:tRNA threonylcarbamoyladenosine biosynthesis protein TsaE